MIVELFPFQRQAVTDLRVRIAMALNNYRMLKIPQVVSLQAPTGSGKTIIMAALIEDVYFGTDNFAEQPDAIFVWLSDSPALNEQSKQKIELKADRISLNQCVVVSEESFDQEMLDDGHIYFLNTQKLSKTGKLSCKSDNRQYTIWETLENTAREKADRLYFIIDEAHRGMQGKAAGTATTIMQRFIKGSPAHLLSPMPVVIGMSATAERFNALVGNTTSTLQKVIISPASVRASGLLKDRIVITYPDDPEKHNDMAVLQAATDEWINKCKHWYQYTYLQHYANVNPVFVVQVKAGSGNKISDNNLDDIIAKIEERTGDTFKENEVVHTFGSVGTIQINGLSVPHVEPSDITDDRRIKLVLFKENLSTGWDCPRAETMMSFRRAEDATYIAQLLGRMIRTPLQSHILVDDSLNDVRLFLPYFNESTVKSVIAELQNTEGGEIPTVIDGESMEEQVFVSWTVHTSKPKKDDPLPGQVSMTVPFSESNAGSGAQENGEKRENGVSYDAENVAIKGESLNDPSPQNEPSPIFKVPASKTIPSNKKGKDQGVQISAPQVLLDREEIIKFINEQGLLTYIVRMTRINSYLRSLLSLAGLLTQNQIYTEANNEVKNEVVGMIHDYIEDLHNKGKYDELAKKVMEFRLSIKIFDVFGASIENYQISDLFMTSDSDLDRQLRAADAKLGNYGFVNEYGRRYIDYSDPNKFKIDCILFAADDECISKLNKYAETKFHGFNDNYRKYVVNKSERCKKQYSDIIANGDVVSKHNFSLPEEVSVKLDKDGKEYYRHLLADKEGIAKIKLNNWEDGVLMEESKRPDFVCWLRNPSKQSWSLCLPYEIDGETRSTYPDFIIVRADESLGYVIDILEPHNPDFKDNLGKAKAFAKYANDEPRIGRIQLIRMGKDPAGKNRFKRLDMALGAVRNKVLAAMTNDELDHIFDTDGFFA